MTLEPGILVYGCRIVPDGASATSFAGEPYLMAFATSGGRYLCPLVCFQARTESVVEQAAEPVGSFVQAVLDVASAL